MNHLLQSYYLFTIPERTKAQRHNNKKFNYIKTSAPHDSIKEQFSCHACLQHYTAKRELRSYYHSNHSETSPEGQRQTTSSDDFIAHMLEKATTSDVFETEQQKIVASNNEASPAD